MSFTLLLACATTIALVLNATTSFAQTKPALPDPLPAHPRLFFQPGEARGLADKAKNDPETAQIAASVIRLAEKLLDAPPVVYQKNGKRLLDVSRAALKRISTLAMANLLTGDARFTRRAVVEMNAVCAFADWNPSHFLDTGEMTLAVAVGYDWLFDQISADERAAFRRAIVEKGINPSFAEKHWWIAATNNWNQVCHGGLVAGALAIAEDEPALAMQVVERAVVNLPRAAKAYAPDGACDEGTMYWGYGASFQVLLADALQNVFNDDFGVGSTPGFLESARYFTLMIAPTGATYNYADCAPTRGVGVEPALYWFADQLKNPTLPQLESRDLPLALARYENTQGQENRLLPFALIWRNPNQKIGDVSPLPLSWHGRGPNPVAVHRSAFGDRDATFIGIKGGSPSTSHAHMDGGSFIFESDGVRWAIDLGMQNYGKLEAAGVVLWDRSQNGPRWGVFGIGLQSHNTLCFDDQRTLATETAEIVKFSSADKNNGVGTTVVDMSPLYRNQATRVMRGARLENRAALLRDEWTAGNEQTNVVWRMVTRAKVEVDGQSVKLTQAGKSLGMNFVAGSDDATAPAMRIEVVEASDRLTPIDLPQPDTRLIEVHLTTPAKGNHHLSVQFWPGGVLDGKISISNDGLKDWVGEDVR